MATFHLTYNPFLVRASITIQRKNDWVPIDEGAGLDNIYKKRLQHWLNEGNRTGGLFLISYMLPPGMRR